MKALHSVPLPLGITGQSRILEGILIRRSFGYPHRSGVPLKSALLLCLECSLITAAKLVSGQTQPAATSPIGIPVSTLKWEIKTRAGWPQHFFPLGKVVQWLCTTFNCKIFKSFQTRKLLVRAQGLEPWIYGLKSCMSL